MNRFTSQRAWHKFKKRFPLDADEQTRRRQYRQRQLRRRLLPVLLFLASAIIFYLLRQPIIQMLSAGVAPQFDANTVIALISMIAGVISAYFAAFPRSSQASAQIEKKLRDFRHRLPRHYIDVHCQDLNPADDAERNPVRQSLREKTWEWLFEPQQAKKSYLLLLGDFGTGKTTFCFYIGQEIIQTMRSLEVEIIELGQEDLSLAARLETIPIDKCGNTVLILDAYDEYKFRGPTEIEFKTLLDLSHNFFKVLVSSRTNYFASAAAEPHLRTRYISYFDESQVQQFLQRNHPWRWRQYWQLSAEYQQFADLSRRPVLLNYMNKSVLRSIQEKKKQGQTLSNYQIYTDIVDNILPDERNFNELLPKSAAIDIMSLLGFHIICCGGERRIHYASLGPQLLRLMNDLQLADSALGKYLKNASVLEQYSSHFVAEIRTRTFLIRDNPGNYRFAHQSFAEYFAARFILEKLVTTRPKNKISIQIPPIVLTFLKEAGTTDEELARLFEWILPSYQFRSNSVTLSDEQFKEMLKAQHFFDRYKNKEGTGISHQYQSLNLAGHPVVLDFATGLMWQQSGSTNSMYFEDAQNWLAQLNRDGFAGYHDWRLPTLEEAMSLMEPEKKNADLYIDPVFDSKQNWIWTSDPVAGGSGRVWFVYFNYGYCVLLVVYDFFFFVRAVRSGQSSP